MRRNSKDLNLAYSNIFLAMAVHDGFLNDVSITFIDKNDLSDPLRREDYWWKTVKTMYPYGLNIEDSVWWVFLCFLFYVVTSVFYTVMSACFMDYDFRITEFVLSVYIVAVVVSILSLLLLISSSLLLLLVLVMLLLSLSLYSHYLFAYSSFQSYRCCYYVTKSWTFYDL